MAKPRVEAYLPKFKEKTRQHLSSATIQLFFAREQGSTRRFHSMEENASGSSSSSAAMQETANAAEVLAELFDGNTCTANAAEVLALKEEVEKLRAMAQAPKRRPGRPFGKNGTG